MDEFDRVFALLDVMSKPGAAAKVAEEMKKVRAQEAINKGILKEAKAESFAAAEERKTLVSERVKVEAFKTEAEAYDVETTRLRREAVEMFDSNTAEVERQKKRAKALEDDHRKKVIELTEQQKALEASIAASRYRKSAAESELNEVLRKFA